MQLGRHHIHISPDPRRDQYIRTRRINRDDPQPDVDRAGTGRQGGLP
jgi:hypothetical protein